MNVENTFVDALNRLMKSGIVTATGLGLDREYKRYSTTHKDDEPFQPLKSLSLLSP
jgi:hypothetical protein